MNNLESASKSKLDFSITLRLNFDKNTDYSNYLSDISSKFANDDRFQLLFHSIGNWDNRESMDYICNFDEAKIKKEN